MDEIIKIFKIGYYEGIKDSINKYPIKKYKLKLNNEIKSKIYDIGYKSAINDIYNIKKNNL